MKLSLLISIYNRSELFARGLATIAAQRFPEEEFEIIIIDDGSTEDISKVYTPYLGKMNIRHVKYDHTKHPIWAEMNPDPTAKENWCHTQAISANIGISLAQGEVTCICQPEMLLSPDSFAYGYEQARQNRQLFAEVHWGTQLFNQWLTENDWKGYRYDGLHEIATGFGAEYQPNHMPPNHYEMYWYTEFFPTAVARVINGVDLLYQRGVYAEDDQFRMRMRMAGATDMWGGRPVLAGTTNGYAVGIHQSHTDEGGKNPRQDRDGQKWALAAEHNRDLFRKFQETPYTVANEGLDYDIWGGFLITEDKSYGLK